MEDAAAPNSGSDLNLGGKRGKSIEECQDMIQRSFRNPIVKFLMEQMEKSGCRVGDNFVKAVVCTGPVAGGFTKGRGITVCSNYLTIQDEVNQVVIHELIHAYDECRAKNLDWTNCAHHACSEELEHGQFVRIRTVHLNGKPRVLTLKQDLHYWPTWELRFDPETALWRRNILKALK
ncbi:hypothetical protein F2Q70_00037809 [Brassica cretica]|uniref:Mitochondrial inner membrane protease ATP23 n=1 Tax=Brassica cretica TaxID=69181 RepID=A0A8S9JWI9_BRACR|nr:hypothetical protein F2Q70_00037809 [Brassica cretica]